eukprot:m.273589 g.273589  ORF g.273589 m.273589 type:complete len:129 (+) comp26885_c1_seq7:5108-5494(+)
MWCGVEKEYTLDRGLTCSCGGSELASMVNADWHDSYEETGEMLQSWWCDCRERVKVATRVGISAGVAMDQCHELFKLVVDVWSNINAIPFRCSTSDALDSYMDGVEVDFTCGARVWRSARCGSVRSKT